MRRPFVAGGQVSGVVVLVAAALVGRVVRSEAACQQADVATGKPDPAFTAAPTLTTQFKLRGRSGAYLAPRQGHLHQGVDLIATDRLSQKALYRVMASGGGIIAYVGNNDPKGYGYTVIIDHQNGEYSLYAHLAPRASRGCVKLGDVVQIGWIIGYAFDPETGELSSGNARAKDGVRASERVQVHIELIYSTQGVHSTSGSAPIKSRGVTADPTLRLLDAGYGD